MKILKSHELLSTCAEYVPQNPVVIEAGAFNGADSVRMAQQWPEGTIHAFEPVPDIFAQLKNNTVDYKNIYTYNVALSNTVGTSTFYVAEKPHKPGVPTQAGSLHAPKKRLEYSPIQFPRTCTVQTTTLDQWAHEHEIKQVDLLWFDMQGHELYALQGAESILQTVSVVCTEVGFVEAYEAQPTMDDVVEFMQSHGFTPVARDFADQSSWFFGNIIFVRSSLL